MGLFDKTREDQIEFELFVEKVDSIYEELKSYERKIDLSEIQMVKKNFKAKTDDFFRHDRKLNIGVIGRVKAGKSTFLNALLFGGREVLPIAVTPKTAVLTRIEYAEENQMEIEFYREDEWNIIKESASLDSEMNEVVVAKEIMSMVDKRNLDLSRYIGKANFVLTYDTYEELSAEINDYVGENGQYTPIVKNVTLRLNLEELEGISIVDTPGLNDPISSRTNKTKQFMELCDVVFFLSKATGFLDKQDVDLVVSQLPQKGVNQLILLCSRFDDGIRDVIWNQKSFHIARKELESKLDAYAANMLDVYKKTHYYVNEQIIEQCSHPVYISSMAYNMSHKEPDQYDEKEKKILEDLSIHETVTGDMLKEIGNLDKVKEIFEQVVDSKEVVLTTKAKNFIPNARKELKSKLLMLQKLSQKRILQLTEYDREQMLEQKKKFTSQINGINLHLEEIFGNWCTKIEDNKMEALHNLRSFYRDALQMNEKEGVKTHFEIENISAARWYKPWTWGKTKKQIYSYDERYKYIDASDAMENIRNFANDASNSIETAFHKSVDMAYIRGQLLNAIMENLDMMDENCSPAYYKLLVAKTLNHIEIPVVNIDVSTFINNISLQFYGEIRTNAKKTELKNALSNALSHLLDDITNIFESEVGGFKRKVDEIKEGFSTKVLEDITKELNVILEQMENKDEEIDQYHRLIDHIEQFVENY